MLHAPNLTLPHGFTTRFGGVSQGVYAAPDGSGGLNMDGRAIGGAQDDPQHVAENRRRAVSALGFAPPDLALLWQIHGADVVQAQPDRTQPDLIQTADAQVSDCPGRLLGILTADCLPILLEDPEAGVIGAAHAGWRGTLERVAERTVAAMQRLGARPEHIRAAVGPGISAACYPVGADVAGQFAAAGLGAHVRERQLDLAGANQQVLLDAGVLDAHLWLSGRCTFEPEFYSHRRDAGRTGRMLALIGLRRC